MDLHLQEIDVTSTPLHHQYAELLPTVNPQRKTGHGKLSNLPLDTTGTSHGR